MECQQTTEDNSTSLDPLTSSPQNNSKQLGGSQVAWNCFVDNPSRILGTFMDSSGSNTPANCIQTCRTLYGHGYKYAGVQYGSQCFCGDFFAERLRRVSQYECNRPCTGNSGLMCVGRWRMSLFYTWNEEWWKWQYYEVWPVFSRSTLLRSEDLL